MVKLEGFKNITLDEAIREIKKLRQSLVGAVQNAECREEKLEQEIERLKRDGRCIAEAKEIYHKGMIDAKIEIEQLKKEKKWLIKACTEFMYGTIEVTSWKDAKDKVLEEMQQELKEE